MLLIWQMCHWCRWQWWQIFWWIGDLPLVSTIPWQICRWCQRHQQSRKLLVSLLWPTSLLYLVSCCCWCFCCFWDPAVVDILSLPGVSAIFGVPSVSKIPDMPGVPSVRSAVVRVMILLRTCCCWHLFWSWYFYVIGGFSCVVSLLFLAFMLLYGILQLTLVAMSPVSTTPAVNENLGRCEHRC